MQKPSEVNQAPCGCSFYLHIIGQQEQGLIKQWLILWIVPIVWENRYVFSLPCILRLNDISKQD